MSQAIILVPGLMIAHLLEMQLRSSVLVTFSQQPMTPGGDWADEKRVLKSAFESARLPKAIKTGCVPMSDLQLLRTIGHGQFGQVYLASWKQTSPVTAAGSFTRRRPDQPSTVAIKSLHRHRMTTLYIHQFLRTASIELSLPLHPNIVSCYGVSWAVESAQVWSVQEYCPGGTLSDALESAAVTWSASLKARIAAGMATGLSFLHSQVPPVIHRDLKPDNILFDDALVPRLGDLGGSRAVSDHLHSMSEGVGTPLFSAPEQLNRASYDESADIWAFGCLLVCLHTHSKAPYSADDFATDSLLSDVCADRVRPTLPASGGASSNAVRELVARCVQYTPSRRPSAATLLNELVTCSDAEHIDNA